MQIPPETLAEGQVAYRQIQRYQKSSSPLLILLIYLIPFIGVSYAEGPRKPLWMLPFILFIAFFHLYQRQSLKKKSEDAQKRLDHLRGQYGPEIDDVAKKSPTLLARRKLLWS
jgi:hypothetical protein